LVCAISACRSSAPKPYAGFLDAPVSQVASQVTGRVDSVAVRDGDHVKKGQLIAQLDARLQQAMVSQAQANVEQARRALDEAEATLSAAMPTVKGAGADFAQAQAAMDEAESVFARNQQLYAQNALSEAEMIAVKARMLEARAKVNSLGANRAATKGKVSAQVAAVARARAGVGTAEAALGVAEVQLAQAQILAPFDGIVVHRNVEPGEWAAPGTPIVTMEDTSQLWVRLDIEESKLRDLRLGQEAQVRIIAIREKTFSGKIIELGAEGDFAINRDVKRGRPDIRTFLVRVGLDDRADELRPGMTAEVSFQLPREPPRARRAKR
jgi:multidrug resistance efflux pump